GLSNPQVGQPPDSGRPHEPQNRKPAAFSWPQLLQTGIAEGIVAHAPASSILLNPTATPTALVSCQVKGYVSRLVAVLALILACLSMTVRPVSAGGLEGIPGYDHVFVLILENESFSSSFGPTSPAHYLNN